MDTAGDRKPRISAAHPIDALVITLPHWRVLRLAARSALLALALLSLPWIGPARPDSVEPADRSTAPNDTAFLATMLGDLKGRGLFPPGHSRALSVGAFALPRLPTIRAVDPRWGSEKISDASVDLVISLDELWDDGIVRFVDRILRDGGVVVTRLSDDPMVLFRVPRNYRLVYVRRFASTIVGMRKLPLHKMPI